MKMLCPYLLRTGFRLRAIWSEFCNVVRGVLVFIQVVLGTISELSNCENWPYITAWGLLKFIFAYITNFLENYYCCKSGECIQMVESISNWYY